MSSPSRPGQCPRLQTRAQRALLPLAGRPCLGAGVTGGLAWIPRGEGLPGALWQLPGLGAQAAALAGAAGSLSTCDPHAVGSPEPPGAAVCDGLRRWAA